MHDATNEILEIRAPARLDRLPWGRFHTLVAAALGITWVLDGLEVTLAGSIAGALAAIAEMIWCVAAERGPLEAVARPLSLAQD
jgi:hypothetical protein